MREGEREEMGRDKKEARVVEVDVKKKRKGTECRMR